MGKWKLYLVHFHSGEENIKAAEVSVIEFLHSTRQHVDQK